MSLSFNRTSRQHLIEKTAGSISVPTGAFTASLWFEPSSYTSATQYGPLLSIGHFDTAAGEAACVLQHERLAGAERFRAGFTDTGSTDHILTPAKSLKKAWYELAMVSEGPGGGGSSELKLWLRREDESAFTLLDSTVIGAVAPKGITEPVVLGAAAPLELSEQFYSGRIADVRIYTEAKSESWLNANMRVRANPADDATLAHYWALDDGHGTTKAPQEVPNLVVAANMVGNPGFVDLVDGVYLQAQGAAATSSPPSKLSYHNFSLPGAVLVDVDWVMDARTSVTSSQLSAKVALEDFRHPLQERYGELKLNPTYEPAWLEFDLGSPKPIDEIAIFDHTMTPSSSRTFLLRLGQDGTTWDEDIYLPMRFGVIRMLFQHTKFYRYVRFEHTHGYTSPEGELRIGKVLVGAALRTRYKPGAESERLHQGTSRRLRTESGHQMMTPRTSYRLFQVPFPRLDEAERRRLLGLAARGYPYIDLICNPGSGLYDTGVYGRVNAPIELKYTGASAKWSQAEILVRSDEPTTLGTGTKAWGWGW